MVYGKYHQVYHIITDVNLTQKYQLYWYQYHMISSWYISILIIIELISTWLISISRISSWYISILINSGLISTLSIVNFIDIFFYQVFWLSILLIIIYINFFDYQFRWLSIFLIFFLSTFLIIFFINFFCRELNHWHWLVLFYQCI